MSGRPSPSVSFHTAFPVGQNGGPLGAHQTSRSTPGGTTPSGVPTAAGPPGQPSSAVRSRSSSMPLVHMTVLTPPVGPMSVSPFESGGRTTLLHDTTIVGVAGGVAVHVAAGVGVALFGGVGVRVAVGDGVGV